MKTDGRIAPNNVGRKCKKEEKNPPLNLLASAIASQLPGRLISPPSSSSSHEHLATEKRFFCETRNGRSREKAKCFSRPDKVCQHLKFEYLFSIFLFFRYVAKRGTCKIETRKNIAPRWTLRFRCTRSAATCTASRASADSSSNKSNSTPDRRPLCTKRQ